MSRARRTHIYVLNQIATSMGTVDEVDESLTDGFGLRGCSIESVHTMTRECVEWYQYNETDGTYEYLDESCGEWHSETDYVMVCSRVEEAEEEQENNTDPKPLPTALVIKIQTPVPNPKPCDGVSPLANHPGIVPPNNWNTNGGLFGCVRYNNTSTCSSSSCGPFGSGNRCHDGWDIGGNVGDDIFSMYGGEVTAIRQHDTKKTGMGNYVIVKTKMHDGTTIYIQYGHMEDVYVGVGTTITKGTDIGTVGRSGNAFNVPNPHIHLRIWNSSQNKKLNPEDYVPYSAGNTNNLIKKTGC